MNFLLKFIEIKHRLYLSYKLNWGRIHSCRKITATKQE